MCKFCDEKQLFAEIKDGGNMSIRTYVEYEQAERDIDLLSNIDISVMYNEEEFFGGSLMINYCPMCGKELRKKHV